MKRDRFITLVGADKSVNRELEAKTRNLARLKGYTTNIANPSPEFVIGAYHQLWVRREALVDRVEVRDLRRCSYRSRTVKLRAA